MLSFRKCGARALKWWVVLPSRDVHLYVDKALFGKSFPKVHGGIDWPYIILRREHRIFFHDPLSARIIAEQSYPDDPTAVDAAYCHILTDQLCSENPEYKRSLEQLVALDKTKKPRKRKKRTPKEEEPYMKDLKKLAKNFAEVRRLHRLIYSLG